MSPQTPEPQTHRKRIVTFGLILGGVALFMYVSIIVKTALMGP